MVLSLENDILIENKRENAVGKVCLLVVEDFDIQVPCLKLKMTSNFVSAHGSHYDIMPKYG